MSWRSSNIPQQLKLSHGATLQASTRQESSFHVFGLSS
ncbi:hypothetical protein ES319_A01G151100v1 [Gossypium barbadense]|uniref:Uncharacterized protein n=1 Tax=Gossypium barbadense TaxID=3634 RepID=A0A5J5WY09_GOSBA|nr:hypothetical protein ES319_A01G151100v1 [Gossypium barbadense]